MEGELLQVDEVLQTVGDSLLSRGGITTDWLNEYSVSAQFYSSVIMVLP